MPTYSYKCTECGTAFDIHQSFSDESLTVCPSCGGRLRKVFSPVGITFNGSGFYRTDSRAASGSTGGSHGKKSASSGSSTGSESTTGSSGSSGTSGSSGSSGSSASGSASSASGSSAPSKAAAASGS